MCISIPHVTYGLLRILYAYRNRNDWKAIDFVQNGTGRDTREREREKVPDCRKTNKRKENNSQLSTNRQKEKKE